MKKNLLIAAVVLPLLSVSAQWTQVGGTVKIEPNTLKFVGQNYEVKGTSTTLNEGFVNVRGNFTATTAATSTTSTGFHNVWTARNAYGQLIVNAASTTSGKIDNQYNLPSGFAFVSMAFPFKGYTSAEAAANAGITSPQYPVYTPGPDDGFDPNRYTASVWTWHNSAGDPKDFYFENNQAGTILTPELYHGLQGTFTGTKGFLGVPENTAKTISGAAYAITTSWDANNRGELYASYVEDVAVPKPNGWIMATSADGEQSGVADGVAAGGYGNNISLYGNPYTSNFDPTLVSVPSEVTHVFYISGNDYEPNVEGYAGNQVYVTTFNGGTVATGNVETDATLFRPHGAYFVRGNGAFTWSLGEGNKTFEAVTNTNLGTSRTNGDNGFYQVTLSLKNSEGSNINNNAYVFASSVIQPGETSRFEAYNTTYNGVGFYSLQEAADGTVFADLADQKTLINGVNAIDYVAKPISLVFNGNGQFTVDAKLTENLINSGNMFYFEDRQTGDIYEVTEGFEYTFTATGFTADRFFMYWNGTPETLAVNDPGSIVAKTIVYKTGDDYKVRFAETWNTADVMIYNVNGQLIHSAKNVSTANDYLLPLNIQTGAYIVKSVGDNGEVSTSKIVKK